jgi:DNA-binding response OmpR family regulator
MRVLIAEDEADIRDLLRVAFIDAGHDAVFASTYSEAEQHLRTAVWDVMVTDMVLPDGNGLDLARAARARGMPALLCTGHPEEAEALQAHGIEYMQKPFSLFALLGRVEALRPLAA